MLPFIRKMVKAMQHKDFVYLFIGYIIMVGVLPSLEYCLSNGTVTIHSDFQPVLFMSQSVFFGLMGYYFEYIFEPKIFKAKIGFIGVGLSLIVLVATCAMTHFKFIANGAEGLENCEIFFNNFIAVPTITMYYLMKQFAKKIVNPKLQFAITLMGSAVFWVYLIEKILRALTGFVYTLIYPIVGEFVAALIWSLAVWIVGLIIVIIIKHIPVIKKVVNKFI